MARISGYNNDSELTGNDLLVGSSYEGLQNGSPKYITRTYKLSDLATYFGGFVNDIDLNDLINRVGNLEDGVDLISTTVTNNTSAIATASQSLTVLTNDVLAQSTFQTNLSSTFGTFDENGNLTSLSQAFADQVLQTTASDRYAKASFVTNLAASVGTYDESGNLITYSNALAEQILSTTASDIEAVAQFSTNLASSFGTYDEEGNLLTLSSGFVDQVISSTSNEIESISEFATNLASSFGTYNPDGTISEFSDAFANQVFTTTAADQFAKATYVNNLGASIGQLNPDGTLVFDINSSYSQGIKTYIENNSAVAQSIETLQAIYTTIPVTIRQPDEPPTLDLFNDLAYPLGSIWVDTDDSNALYVLIEDAGSPTGYSWSPTTSEALGDLILSNSQLQQEVNFLSTSVSTEAQKLDTLRSKFGYFDINGDFIVENTSEIIADLRTYADAESTSAKKIDGINSVFNMVDANGNVIKNLATFNQEITTYVDANSAIATRVDDLEVDVAGNAAAISTEQSVRATEIGAVASSVSSLGTTVSGFSNTISVQQQSIDGILGKYGVSIDQNGNIAGYELLNGTGGSAFNVSVDAFNIYSGTSGTQVFAVDAGQVKLNVPLNGVSGTFTGRLTAGGVDIYNDDIKLNIQSFGSQIKFVDDAGNDHTSLTASGPTGNFIILCEESIALLSKDGAGNNASSLQLRKDFATLFTPGGHINLTTSDGVFLTASGESAPLSALGFDSFIFYAGAHRLQGSSSSGITVASGLTTLTVNETGVFVNGQQLTPGGPTTDTNYYLNGITRSGNTLTFSVAGTASQSYTFGANAFNSTTIPTNNNQLTNGAGYITTTGSYTFSGSLTAQDFILSSDRILKENIKEYKPKPINIQYKTYNLIGDENKRVGVIAQELEIEHPEFIRENENGIKSVSYIDMLVAKVAELEARIKELEHGGTK